jgi:U4/U6 small nuclear ribonucleoprotein PRP31
MSGLAEELAADLADLDDEEYEYEEEATVASLNSAANWPPNGATKRARSQDAEGDEEMSDAEVAAGTNALDAMGVMAGGVRPAEQLDAEAVARMELGTVEDVSKVAKLYGSKRMRDIVNVRQRQGQICISGGADDGGIVASRILICSRPNQALLKNYPLMPIQSTL